MTPTRSMIGLLGLTLALTGAANLLAADKVAVPALTKDWPNWRGPICSGATGDCGEKLVDDLSRARLLWVSEEDIPANVWSGGRHGSYDSPVVAGGKVFIGFNYGKGIDWKQFGAAKKSGGELGREWVVCDYVLIALDAMTGKTAWRKVLDQGPNMVEVRKRPGGHHAPCFWKGKVYAQSTLGRIYCLDAKTGAVQWQVDGYKTADQIKIREVYLETGKMHYGMNQVEPEEFKGKDVPKLYQHGYPVIVVDGVVIADAAPRIDALTGKVLGEGFKKPTRSDDRGGDHCEPLRWTVDGQEYVLKGGLCYEPRSGKVRWKINQRSERAPALGSGYAVYSEFRGGLRCYAITPDGAEKKWELTTHNSQAIGVIQDGWYYGKLTPLANMRDPDVLMAIELATGKQVGPVLVGPGKSGNPSPGATDGRIFMQVTHGETFGIHMAKMDPKDLRVYPGFLSYTQLGRLAHGSSLALADGRLYVRSANALRCYDLRAANALKPGEQQTEGSAMTDQEEEE